MFYTRQGNEFLVNTETFSIQESPAITALSGGRFLVTWTDNSGAGGDNNPSGIKGQIFDAGGQKIGSEILINTQIVSTQSEPATTVLSDGSFVVVWTDNSGVGDDASGKGIRGQRFTSEGAKLGSEFLVNTETFNEQLQPAVTKLAGSGFVVTWTDFSNIGGDTVGYGIKAQVFANGGAKVGSEILVNTQTTANQQEPSIAGLSDGRFVVTWGDFGNVGTDNSSSGVKAQIFSALGQKIGSEFLVNTQVAGAQQSPKVLALSDGRFVISWSDSSSLGTDVSGIGVKAQIFAADGQKSGGEFLINTSIFQDQLLPDMTALADGRFVVTWSDEGAQGVDMSGSSIKGQIFAADGQKVGGEFFINSETVRSQNQPVITALSDGSFAVAWKDDSRLGADTSLSGIKAQIFSPSTAITDIALSATSLPETAVDNIQFARVTSNAVGTGITFSIVADSSNGGFRIEGDRLIVEDSTKLDFETAPQISLTIRATDDAGAFYDEALVIDLLDVGPEARFEAGNDFLVNTQTLNSQLSPAITTLADGRFLVTWTDQSRLGVDTSFNAVKGQIFSAEGVKDGSEFLVNTTTEGDQQLPAVTALAGGGFVASWNDFSSLSDPALGFDIRAQIFSASGEKSGTEFRVNTRTAQNQTFSAVTALADGRFIITWADASAQSPDTEPEAVKAQIFTATGAKSGTEFLINTQTASSQYQPTITGLSDGRFVVAWTDLSGVGGDASSGGIKAQLFSSAGQKIGGEILVNTTTASAQQLPAVAALSDGRFVVSWMDTSLQGGDASGYGIKAQIFTADGLKSGSEFLVNTQTVGTQSDPFIATLSDGKFVISWTDQSLRDLDGNAVRGQVFTSDGQKAGGEFLINSPAVGSQTSSAIAPLANGSFAVVWADAGGLGEDPSNSAIKARIFSAIEEEPTMAVILYSSTNQSPANFIASYATIQDAVNAAVDGNSLFIQSGTYTGNVLIDKAISVFGANVGIAGAATRSFAESVIEGTVTVTDNVTINGVQILNSSDNSTQFVGVRVQGDVDVTVTNSRFFSTGPNGNNEDRAILLDTSAVGSVTITNNYIGGAATGKFGSSASWHRGIWSDGAAEQLTVTGNTFEFNRTGINLDGFDDTAVTVTGNQFITSGSGISFGSPVSDEITDIRNNTFTDVDSDFNLQNLTTPISFDLDATNNVGGGSGAASAIAVLGTQAGDVLTGTDGADFLIGNGGADILKGGSGDDTLNGGGGSDTIVLSGTIANYAFNDLAISGGQITGATIVGPDGTDTIAGVEALNIGGTFYVLPGMSIQAAINAAPDNATIVVAAGTYTEQLSVDGRSGLTITAAAGAEVIVKAPAVLAVNGTSVHYGDPVRAVIAVTDSDSISITGIEVDGSFAGDTTPGSNGDELTGIAYLASSGSIDDVEIANVSNSTVGGLFGLQHGSGLFIDGKGAASTPAVSVTNSAISNFQKTGALIIGVDLTFTGNTITGIGGTGLTAQNGLQVAQSSGTISGNTITAFGYEVPVNGTYFYSSGIIAYEPSGALGITGNTITGAATGEAAGLDLSDTGGNLVTVDGNTFSTLEYGVYAYTYTGGTLGLDAATITNNTFTNISVEGLHFAPEESFGAPFTTSNGFTVSGTQFDDVLAGSVGADTLSGQDGDDTLQGNSGNDTLDGGSGTDTGIFDSNLGDATVGTIFDPVTGRVIAFTSVTTAGDGAESVTNVEALKFADATLDLSDPIQLFNAAGDLVGTFDGIQAAVDAADTGATIRVAAGTYDEDVTVNKAVTILGPNEGTGGADTRVAEAIIDGKVTVTAAATLDGLQFLNSSDNATRFDAVTVSTSGDVTIINSLFFSTGPNGNFDSNVAGLGIGDTAIFVVSAATGKVTISDNYITGAAQAAFSTASWARGIWSDGNASELKIVDNTIEYSRTAMNLDGYNDTKTIVSGNSIESSGSGVSMGIPVSTVITAITNNTFTDVADEFNFQNVTTPLSFDAAATNNVAVTGVTAAQLSILAGSSSDVITGTSGADRLIGNNGNDVLKGGLGDDTITAGGGSDTLVLSGAPADYTFSGLTVTNGVVAGTISGPDGTDTVSGIEALKFDDTFYVLSGMSIQAAVNAAPNGATIVVAAGTYTEQVSINGRSGITIVAETGADVTIKAPVDVVETGLSSSGRQIHAVVTAVGSTDIVLENINVDGAGVGNTVSGSNPNYVGVFFRNSNGGLQNVDIFGVRDPYDNGTTVSGNQRGVGVQVDNDSLLDFSMQGGSITDFQKNATVFSRADLNVSGVTITGGGAQTINAQNGIQVLNSTGSISGNTITEIGYAGAANAYSGLILAYGNTGLDITDNVIVGTNNDTLDAKAVGIFVLDFGTPNSGGSITGNTISFVDSGIDVSGAIEPNGILIENNTVTDIDATDPYAAGLSFSPTTGTLTAFNIGGTAEDDFITGGNAADTLSGEGGDDTIDGNGDNDTLDGGLGTDTAVFGGNAADATVTSMANAGGFVVQFDAITTGTDGTDTLAGFERLQFADRTLDLADPVQLFNQTGGLIGTFDTIQAAVDAAGTVTGPVTVLVNDGTYAENVVIDRSDLTLLSVNGRDAVTIEGVGTGGELGTIEIDPGANNVTIGGVGKGFTVIGLNGNGGIEKAAIYLQGAHDNIDILDNEIVANGDAGLLSEFNLANTNLLIDGNEFSGQTFIGTQPGGEGFGTQFDAGNNVPRQLVVLGGGGSPANTLSNNIVFTNNLVSGTAGGISSTTGNPQGNTLVTIDAADSTISNNEFTGFTDRFGTAIRARGPNTDIENNILDEALGQSRGIFVQNQGSPGSYEGNIVNGGAAADVITSMTDGDDELNGNGGNDTLVAGAGSDTINGGDGNDLISGGLGNDQIDGGADFDTAAYAGNRADFTVVTTTDSAGRVTGFTSIADTNAANGDEGTDTLTGIEALQFANGTLDLADAVQLFDANDVLVGTFDTIQAAVDAASDGYTLLVNSGTFTETVTVDVAVSILGNNAGTIAHTAGTLNAARAAESTLNGTFVIASDGVTISGFEITGGADAVRIGGSLTAYDDLTISNNYIHDTTDSPIRAGLGIGGGIGSENWSITGNLIDGIDGNARTGMVLFNIDGLTLDGNAIIHDDAAFTGRRGINLDGIVDGTVTNNIVSLGLVAPADETAANTAAPWGIQISMSDREVQNLLVDGNTVTGARYGITTLNQRGNEDITITNNLITDVYHGIGLQVGGVAGPGTATDTTVTNNEISATFSGVRFGSTVAGGSDNPYVNLQVLENTYTIANAAGFGVWAPAGHNTTTAGTGADSSTIQGSDGNDLIRIVAGSGTDSIQGLEGNDVLQGAGGNDTLDGGDGEDTVVLSGNWSDYTIDGTGQQITDNRAAPADGTDTTSGVELFQFANVLATAAEVENDAPLGVNDALTAGGTINVLTNDTDADSNLGDTKTVTGARAGEESATAPLTSVTGPTVIQGTYGSLTINADGSTSYAFNPTLAASIALAEGATATESFTYQVTDIKGLADLAQIDVTVTGINDEPTGVNDTNSTNEGTDATGDVLDNDTDPDGDTLVVTSVNQDVGAVGTAIEGEYGTLTLNFDGTYTYVTNDRLGDGDTGTDTFTYTLSDTLGGSTAYKITFDAYDLGPLTNNENGWQITNPAFDQDIVTDSDGKALQFTRQVTSGSFGDQLYSPAVAQTAGEEGVTNSFEASFTVNPNAIQPDATNSFIGVSMDNGTGARGNLLRLETDAAGNWHLYAFDYDGATGTFPQIDLGILPIGEDTKIGFTQVFNPGSGNDVWTVYVNDKLVYTGEGWEDYFSSPGEPTPSPVIYDRLLFRASSSAAVGDQGVLIDDVSVTTNQQATLAITVTGANDVATITGTLVGDVTEDTDLTATGTLAVADADDGEAVFAAASGATSYGDYAITAAGEWTFNLDNTNAAVQALAVGETLNDFFTVESVDTTANQTVTITITGTNDAPTIEAGTDATGAVTEDATPTTLSDTGQIVFDDIDLSDVHSVSVSADTGNTLGGSLAAVVSTPATGSGTGAVTWTYELANGAAQALAAGEQVTESFTVTIEDDEGATVDQVVTVTITGTNDAPTIEAGTDDAGAVTEDASSVTLSDSGEIVFDDVDLRDGHSVSVAADGGNSLGGSLVASVSTVATGASVGAVTWTYELANSAAQALAAGQQVTESFTVTIDDDNGGTVDQVVTITVTGTNDEPTIEAGTDDAGAVTEDASSTTLSDTGDIVFDDIDLTDTHTVTVAADTGNTLGGTLAAVVSTVATGAGTGAVTWSYELDNAATQSLAAGEQVTESFTVTIDDNKGGTVDQLVTVTVTGTNDAPTISGGPATATYAEPIDNLGGARDVPALTGTLTVSDVDTSDTVTGAVQGDAVILINGVAPVGTSAIAAANALKAAGLLSFTPATPNGGSASLGWSYDPGSVSLDFLNPGDSLTVTYQVKADDGLALSASTETVVITITGTAETQVGNETDETLSGNNAFADDLSGEGGDDILDGRNGNDLLDGGEGDDILRGGANDDRLIGGEGSDTIQGGSGNDTAVFAKAWTEYNVQRIGSSYFVEDRDTGDTDTLNSIEFLEFAGTSYVAAVTADDAPVAVNNNGAAGEDGTVQVLGNVLSNDTDADLGTSPALGDSLLVLGARTGTEAAGGSFQLPGTVLTGTYGVLTINADGSYTYDLLNGSSAVQSLKQGQTVTDSFAYRVVDSKGLADTGQLQITVTGTNDAPVVSGAVTLPAAASNTATVVITAAQLLANASDVDGDTLSVVNLVASSGTLVNNGGGVWSFTPVANGPAQVNFTFAVSDGITTTAATATLAVADLNDAPVAKDLTLASASEDAGVSLILDPSDLATDIDSTLTSASFAFTGATVNGNSVSLASAGITYDSATGAFSVDTANNPLYQSLKAGQTATVVANFTASDGSLSDTGSVTVQITGANDAPVAVNDNGLVATEGETAIINPALLASNDVDIDGDALTVVSVGNAVNGSVSYVNGYILFTPAPDYFGPASFDYTITDGTTTSTATAFVQVANVNDAPTAPAAQTFDIDEDGTTGAVSIGAADLDGDTLGYSIATGDEPAFGSVVFDQAAGTFTYTPNANANGTDTFTITVSDGAGGVVTQEVTVNVAPVNDAPTAPAAQTFDIDEDGTTGAVSIGAADLDGDTLGYSIATGDEPAFGSVVFDQAAGTFTYTPNANANGTDTFTITVSDGAGGVVTQEVTVNVAPVNDAPTAPAAQTFDIDEDGTTGAVSIGAADLDGDTLGYSIATGDEPAFGSVVFDQAAGTFTYTPNANANGTDTFTITVSDGAGGVVTQEVTVNVAPVNDAPTAPAAQTFDIDEDGTTGAVSIGAADLDGDTLGYSIATGDEPAFGSVVFDQAAGTFTYTPNANANGTDTFTITVSDGAGGVVTQEVTVNVAPVNDAPTAPAAQTFDIDEDGTTGAVSIGAADLDGDTLGYSIATGDEPAFGSVVFDQAAGTFTYTPNANANGTDTFTITVSDGAGGVVTQEVTVNVAPVNDAPTAPAAQTFDIDEDGTTGAVSIGAADLDGDTLGYSIATGDEPAFGSVVFDQAAGTFTYTPNANANGTDTFTITVSDGAGGVVTQEVTVNVAPVNDAPTAPAAQTFDIDEDGTTGAVSIGAADLDGDTLGYSIATGDEPAFGSVVFDQAAGTFTYTPNANANGTDTFTITVSDGAGGVVTQEVTVNVAPVNDAPTAPAAQTFDIDEDGTTGAVSIGAADLDGDTLGYSIATGDEPAFGSVVFDQAAGTFTYTPNANANGTDTFTITVSDGAGGVVTQEVTVNVAPVNDAPTAPAAQTFDIDEDGTTGAVSIGAADLDGDTLGYSIATGDEPAFGSVVFDQAAGTFTYTPNANANGTDTFTITVSDGAGGVVTQEVTVNVAPVNDAPTDLTLDNASVDENSANGTVVGTATPTDIDSTGFTFALLNNAGGRFAINSLGQITVANAALLDFETNASHSIEIEVTDASGASYTETFTIAVNDVLEGSTYTGTAGNDTASSPDNLPWTANGLAGNDDLTGGNAGDIINGGEDNDVLEGRGGADQINGGNGNDTARYTLSAAAVTVNLLAATATGGDAQGDVLTSIENLIGSAFGDTLTGDNQNNILTGGAGADTLVGSGGIDTANYAGSSSAVTVDLSLITAGFATGTGGDAEGDRLQGIENLIGSAFADRLSGGTGGGELSGGDGADILRATGGTNVLRGGNGDDQLRAASANDTLIGGADNDTYVVVATATQIVELANEGIDTVSSRVTFTLGAHIENLTLTGNALINGTGNDESNTIFGNDAANTLRGGGGALDIIRGLGGNDILIGDEGTDRLHGDSGADIFRWESVSGIGTDFASADQVQDFSRAGGDKLDLSLIDADINTVGDQAFNFIGNAEFTGVAGQLRTFVTANNQLVVAGDINGDSVADLFIRFSSTSEPTLIATDFNL